MKLSIKRFLLTSLTIIIALFYSAFYVYFLYDEQNKANIVIDHIQQDLAETSYILSSELEGLDSINKFKSFLNRKVANSPLLSAISIAYDDKIILSTDPKIANIPPLELTLKKLSFLDTSTFLDHSIYSTKVRFYIQNNPTELTLYFYANEDYLNEYFYKIKESFFTTFGLLPILILAIFWLALRGYLSRPLEILRQYAYYQSNIPDKMALNELEAVRSSMVQTFERLEQERKDLYQLARTDNLSGLANRNLLNERLKWLIAESERTDSYFALLFLDLDNFKTINDSLGHDTGDLYLKKVAKLLQTQLREYDIIARIGGDEFVIVLSQYRNLVDLNHILNRILHNIHTQEISSEEHAVRGSVSIGVAFYPKDGQDITTLMKSADIAMYEAKKAGKNQFKFFTASLQTQVMAEIELESDMRKALKNDEFELYYQPQVDVASNTIIGVEALIRWIHPLKGMIPPYDFIPAAEKNGLMNEIGYWVLETAFKQQVAWKQSGMADLKMSVNLSARQLIDKQFDTKFMDIMENTQISPSKLEIEMTESVLLENTKKNLASLKKIRAEGVLISLDDFGTGYSSLSYLKTLPINILKIDKSFMDDYHNPTGAIFIETMLKIAKTLNIEVIAEGIETTEQLNYLKSVGCETYQGYLCAKPLPAQDFADFYQRYR